MLRELDHVGRAIAQRRDFQVHHVEAEQQVFAEACLAHRLRQIAVRGGDDADVDRHRLGAADAVDHPLLDRAQQLGLQAHVHFGDFVEQQRAAVGLLEFADAAGDGAGEGALFVAEQLGFEQLFRDRRAVDANERRARAVGAARARSAPAPPCRCPIRRRSAPRRRYGAICCASLTTCAIASSR